MRKTVLLITGTILLMLSSLSFSATLTSMSKVQFEHVFVNKTVTSIATDNLNGRTINNKFSMFLDEQGHIWGRMLHKPINEPQTDKGKYVINADGTFYITWQHWDNAKRLCGHVFETKNAYISIGCDDVFHTAFMKASVQFGNHLE